MKGFKAFIIGFSFSLASVSLGNQLYHLSEPKNKTTNQHTLTQIDLFKKANKTQQPAKPLDIFATIEHQSFIKEAKAEVIGQIPQESPQNITQTDTPNDDEILSINIDGAIPIEYNQDNLASQRIEVLNSEEDDLSAMLPLNIDTENDFAIDDPWEIAKAGKNVKNKQLLEKLEAKESASDIGKNLSLSIDTNKEDSYYVAEKIKSSILFPIPNEILSDENLTPTFIKGSKKKTSTPKKTIETQETTQTTKDLKVIPQQPIETPQKTENSKGFFDNISSWFSSSDEKKPQQKVKKAPSYSSQGTSRGISQASASDNSEFINFYRTLQETSIAHQNNSIIPSELKLSFQPERAEISGQTLRWLKAFSEAAQKDDTYLQIRLDANASTELQRKRLSLLYTIFMNNGVDFKKIDTVFSLTEPNAFIIRTLKVK